MVRKKKETKQEELAVKIRRVGNGLILTAEAGESPPEQIVFQERYGEEVECFADFLRLLNEHFGPITSRYSEKRIYVRVEPGDKFTGGE